jgi:hypothetical protein
MTAVLKVSMITLRFQDINICKNRSGISLDATPYTSINSSEDRGEGWLSFQQERGCEVLLEQVGVERRKYLDSH